MKITIWVFLKVTESLIKQPTWIDLWVDKSVGAEGITVSGDSFKPEKNSKYIACKWWTGLLKIYMEK